jgi:hypothetical protein
MTNDKVYNLIILDESGSMASIKHETISGFNEVVQTIKGIEKKFPEQQHFISLVTFNGLAIKTILDRAPAATLGQIDKKSYNPDAATPLYDAIALSVLKLKMNLAGIENTNVLVTILTDGEENASIEFNQAQVKSIITEQRNHGWTFTYIGANHDVEQVAHAISITNTLVFESDAVILKHTFAKENLSRQRYSEKIRNKEEKQTGYYDEPADA